MKTLLFERNLARFAASRVASALGSGRGAGIGPLRLVDLEAPALPGPDWVRVTPLLSGICGSDLATLDGRSSRYFEDIVSFPFVPGHEVVGTVAEATPGPDAALTEGQRVVLQPVLSCEPRGIEPRCRFCAEGRIGNCERTAFGHLKPGLQTGFCTDTGGGWSAAGLVAHRSQLHPVPERLSDDDAVTVEPVACAVHAVLGAGLADGMTVAVLGAGMLGLGVVAAIGHLAGSGRLAPPAEVVVGAKYAHQRRLADELGASDAVPPDQLSRAVRRRARSLALGPARRGGQRLTGGADVVFDCVGSSASLEASLEMVRPRGRVVLVGMPGRLHVDLASLWHREVELVGTYAYGTERAPGADGVSTFALALETVGSLSTGRLVSARYPLERFEEALAHAGAAGRRGAVRVAFDLRPEAAPPRRPAGDERKGRRP